MNAKIKTTDSKPVAVSTKTSSTLLWSACDISLRYEHGISAELHGQALKYLHQNVYKSPGNCFIAHINLTKTIKSVENIF
jgi:hypothetical protein